jgi:hypothetical protein
MTWANETLTTALRDGREVQPVSAGGASRPIASRTAQGVWS